MTSYHESKPEPTPTGWWTPGARRLAEDRETLRPMLFQVDRPIYFVRGRNGMAAADDGVAMVGAKTPPSPEALPLLAMAPALHPSALGDDGFKAAYGLRYAYVCGAMANGITSTAMVERMGRIGMIGFFGAAGLPPDRVEAAIDTLERRLPDGPYGFNLIHSPNDPDLETAVVDLYLRRRVRRVSASAYLRLTPQLVAYRVAGIHRASDGTTVCPNRVKAKVSRVEVASRFLAPPPAKILKALVEQGRITSDQAELAAQVPVAEDLTAEADSGGHTDNRPALALLPTMLALRDEMMEKYRYDRPLNVGLGGGIATPQATAAAFSMGAAYVLAGSVHQACVESGTTDLVRRMLAEARQADVVMAPAADMFEMGVKVQVLKRGTLFPVRAAKLYDLYRRYDRWEQIPQKERDGIERDLLRASFGDAWSRTEAFFAARDPRQIERAEKDPHHKMALVFRSYLGLSSRWPITSVDDRQLDFQIWCGPSMGAFNAWTAGTFLASPVNRDTMTVAMNLLYGATVATRIQMLRAYGLEPDPDIMRVGPLTLDEIREKMGERM